MILDKIRADLKKGMKAKDKFLVSSLRYLLAQIQNQEIALRTGSENKALTDEQVTAIIRKEIKKRNEAATVYQRGGRKDLAEKEEEEAHFLSKYLPMVEKALLSSS